MNFLKKPFLAGSRLDGYLSRQYNSSQFSYKQIFAMLLPLIIDQFFIFFISMLTASLISSSSQAAMAAVALVNPITMIVMSLFFAISSGGTVIVAQYKGKGDDRLVKKSAGQVILITFIVATISSMLLVIFARPILSSLYPQIKQDVLDKSVNYLIGFCISVPVFSIFNGIFSVLRGVGETKVCLHLTIIINLIHLVASIVFINFLNLGIMGTAISYNVARFIGAGIALYVIFSPRTSIKLSLKHFRRLDIKLQKAIFAMGIPFAIEQIFFQGGLMISQIFMAPLGENVIAANSIAASVSNIFYGAGFGVATLAITVVGQCIGAGEIDAARMYGKRMIKLGTVMMIGSIIVLYPLSPLLLNLFHPEAATLPLINMAILIGIIPVPFFWSLSYITPGVLRAAGDANYASVVSLITMWVARVFLGYVFAIVLGFGLNGLWVSIGVEWAIRSVFFYARFKGNKWLKKSVI